MVEILIVVWLKLVELLTSSCSALLSEDILSESGWTPEKYWKFFGLPSSTIHTCCTYTRTHTHAATDTIFLNHPNWTHNLSTHFLYQSLCSLTLIHLHSLTYSHSLTLIHVHWLTHLHSITHIYCQLTHIHSLKVTGLQSLTYTHSYSFIYTHSLNSTAYTHLHSPTYTANSLAYTCLKSLTYTYSLTLSRLHSLTHLHSLKYTHLHSFTCIHSYTLTYTH